MIFYSDHESESDATQVDLQKDIIDEYMIVLLDKFDMNWEKIIDMTKQHVDVLLKNKKFVRIKRARNKMLKTKKNKNPCVGGSARPCRREYPLILGVHQKGRGVESWLW